MSIGAEGGPLTVSVTTSAPGGLSCTWTASVIGSAAEFIQVTGPGSNSSTSGNAVVTLNVGANIRGQRSGEVLIAGVTFTVNQGAAACRYVLGGDVNRTFPAAGGTGTLTVSIPQGVNCAWTATSGAEFITNVSPVSGTGDASVTFTVTPNSGVSRTGTLVIAGQTITVVQAEAGPGEAPHIAVSQEDFFRFRITGNGFTPNVRATECEQDTDLGRGVTFPVRCDPSSFVPDSRGNFSFSTLQAGNVNAIRAEVWFIDGRTQQSSNHVTITYPANPLLANTIRTR
jgi:hypothetical protein